MANVMVSRFANHAPLHRQEQIIARQGVLIDRATLAFLVGYKQVIGFACGGPPVTLALCWSHLRHGFYDPAKSGTSLIATEALVRLAALYRSKTEIRGKDPAERFAQRQIDELMPWC